MSKYLNSTLFLFFLSFVFTSVLAQNRSSINTATNEQHFTPIWTSAYQPMNIYVTEAAYLDGTALTTGDEIGVFDGDDCVGVGVLTGPIVSGSPLSIVASADDATTTEKDGFTTNNPIMIRVWDSNTSSEILDATVVFDENYSETFQPLGTALISISVESGHKTRIKLNMEGPYSNGSMSTSLNNGQILSLNQPFE